MCLKYITKINKMYSYFWKKDFKIQSNIHHNAATQCSVASFSNKYTINIISK